MLIALSSTRRKGVRSSFVVSDCRSGVSVCCWSRAAEGTVSHGGELLVAGPLSVGVISITSAGAATGLCGRTSGSISSPRLVSGENSGTSFAGALPVSG